MVIALCGIFAIYWPIGLVVLGVLTISVAFTGDKRQKRG